MVYITRGTWVYVRFESDVEPAIVETVNRDGSIRVRFIRDDWMTDIHPDDIRDSENGREGE